MSKNLQIRNVPDDVHATVRARAAAEGLSVSEYLLNQIMDIARHPTQADVFARAARRARDEGPTVDDILTALDEGRRE
ncbi:antitoxin [Actinomadura sp. DC4]|uniref:FitA-like ribbon-helix-helix domain-containing protein n=1 Tax=Actinomadura sp. DC4 TaxID=3055069 RepID=UPI0025B0A888|nr:antitoxin [Actinomadura sp. DC4]MDN3353934.1 antitoxin [Actinomadura sp. DC4]